MQLSGSSNRRAGIPRTPDGKPNLTAPPPRTPDGRPDLSGLWTKVSPKYARNIAADLKPDEIQPWAREVVERRREDLGKDGMQVRCLPLGPAYATSGDSTGSEMTRIVQTPQLIVMLNPDLTYRQIWMDGRALEPEPNPSWMGYSVGRWEGDTLVVESYGFHAGTWLDRDGHPHTEQLRLTERYRRPSFRDAGNRGHVLGSRDVRQAMDGERQRRVRRRHRDARVGVQRGREPEPGALGRQGLGRTAERSEGGAGDPGAIRGYLSSSSRRSGETCKVGGSSQAAGRTVQITLESGRLVGDMDGRGKQMLVAMSESEFTGLYGLGVQFIEGGLYVKHVSGNYRFARK